MAVAQKRKNALTSSGGKRDRRVARTFRSLSETLHALILEKGYEQISVGELVAQADVGRSTFYAHFGGKDRLLTATVQQARPALIGASENSGALLSFSRRFFELAFEHRHLHRALSRHGGESLVIDELRRMLSELVRADLAKHDCSSSVDIPEEALVRFVVSTALALAWWSTQNEAPVAAGEIDAIFRRLVIPGLITAGFRDPTVPWRFGRKKGQLTR
jgi:AcrR family transcriptional regulator